MDDIIGEMKPIGSEDNRNFLSVNNFAYNRRHSDLPPRPKLDSTQPIQKIQLDKSTRTRKTGIHLSIETGNRKAGARRVTDGGQTAGLLLHNFPRRRESFLYRSDSDFEASTRSSRNHSLTGDETSIGHSEEMIITPFAQILSSLKKIKVNFMLLTNISSTKGQMEKGNLSSNSNDKDSMHVISIETLEELEWCLSQLETIQTSQSVSKLANLKFRKILTKELNLTEEKGSQNRQVSDYIFKTFLDESDCFPMTRQSGFFDNVVSLNNKANRFDLYSSVSTSQRNRIHKFLEAYNYDWNMDPFELHEITSGQPLCFVTYYIFQSLDLFSKFPVNIEKFFKLLRKIEQSYNSQISYHNSIHAADVTHTTHVLLSTRALKTVFTDLEIMSIIIASVIHDVDHPGLTNQFLINTNNRLAIIYNDISILENHHLSVAFKLFHEEEYSAFESLEKRDMLNFRKMIIDMVIATDMSKHMTLLADLKTLVETRKVAGSGVLTMEHYCERVQVLQVMIHCSDLSNPTKSLSIYQRWVDRIMQEFFQQGDEEKALGIDISPMCDRNSANVAMSQVSFIDYIVHPLWETWADLVYPECQFVLDTIELNRNFYQNQAMDSSNKDYDNE